MARILVRSFYEALIAPALYALVCFAIVFLSCWPIVTIFLVGGRDASTYVILTLLATQIFWWLMLFTLVVQVAVHQDSKRRDLSVDPD